MGNSSIRLFLLTLSLLVFAPSVICENVTQFDEVTISIISPRDSSLWVGTKSHGLMRVGATGRPFSYSTLTGHLTCDHIKSLYFDDRGVLWILDGDEKVLSYSSIDGFVRHSSDALSPAVKTALFSPVPAQQDIAPSLDPVSAQEELSSADSSIPWYGRWWTFALILILLVFAAYFAFVGRNKPSAATLGPARVFEPAQASSLIQAHSPARVQSPTQVQSPAPAQASAQPKSPAKADSSVGAEGLFAEKVSEIIENRFRDPEFGVESIAEELALSRVHLSRKLKAINAPSPSDMIKKRRMDEAAALIRSGETNIAKVATLCGFSSAAYFSAAFKQFYGQTPSNFI